MDYEEDVYVDILDECPVERNDHADYKGKGVAEPGDFDRWDGGSVSGDNDSDHYYSRCRSQSRDKSYKHEAGGKGRKLSSRYEREADSDEDDKEEQLSRRHTTHGPAEKEHYRNYRRRQRVDDDDDNSDEEAEEEQFTGKLIVRVSEDKEQKRNYRRRPVVDDDYSDEEAEAEHITRKVILHESRDKERHRNYRRRRVVDDDYSDEVSEEEHITRKVITHDSGDKVDNTNNRLRNVVLVNDEYSDDEAEEQLARRLIKHGSGDKQHSRNSKRRRKDEDDYSDKEFKLAAKHSKERDDWVGHDWQCGRILSRHRSKSRGDEMSEDHIDRDRSRQKDNNHVRKRGHHQDRHPKHHRERRDYDVYMKKRGDAEADKYKRRPINIHHSTRYQSEHDDDDYDDWEREVMERERHHDYLKEKGRDAKEEKDDRRRDVHHSVRYRSEHDDDDDDDCEREILERGKNYDYMKESGDYSEEDGYNRRHKKLHRSTRYQGEHDGTDIESEIMKRERDSWERVRERKDDSYDMKHTKREKYRDFRGHNKEFLTRTRNRELSERGKERDIWEYDGDCLEESRETNRNIESRKEGKELNFVKRDLRIQITEAKEKSHQREATDGVKKKDSREQESQSLETSLKWELEERQKERDLVLRDRACRAKSKEIQPSEDSKGGSWKMNYAETTESRRERETTGKSSEREKIHKVIRKKDLTERDITNMEVSHVRERDKEIRKIIPRRDFHKIDSRKQDTEDGMHVVKEIDLEEHNRGSREVSQEIEWDRKTRQRYQNREFLDRDTRTREGIHNNALERGGVSRLNERPLRKLEQENKEELHERRFNNEAREATRRDLVRDTWKPDTESREKCAEIEIMHKENEEDHKTLDVDREKSQQEELLNKVEEKRRRECDKISHKMTLENDYADDENEIDLMTRGIGRKKVQQKEIFYPEEKHQRLGDKRSHETTLKNGSMDYENEGKSRVHYNVRTGSTEGETVREFHEEKEKCREHHNVTKEEEADAGTELERQQKTVFVYQISTKADDRDVYDFFSKAGKVRDVRLVMDPISGHFVGVGYVEFYHAMSIPVAASLSGRLLHGQPVMVKPPEPDTNQVHSIKSDAGGDLSGHCPGGSNRLCVSDVHDKVTEALLVQVFEAFGTIKSVQFAAAEAGHCERNYIIQFARFEDARAALSLNGHMALAGQLIKVSPINNHDEEQVAGANTSGCIEAKGNDLGSPINNHGEQQVVGAKTIGCNEAEGNDMVSDIVAQNEMQVNDAKNGVQNEIQEGSDAKNGVQNEMQGCDDANKNHSNEEEGSGMACDGQSELALQKLDPCGIEQNNGVLPSSIPVKVDYPTLPSESNELLEPPSIQAFTASLKRVLQVPGAAIPIVDTVGVPSECLLLKNMFSSNMQNTDDFELRVKEDVEEKCYKFAKPKEIHIDKNSVGFVYLRFEDTKAAVVTQRALHGRWFSGKMITATYMAPQIYDAKFPNTEQPLAQGPPPAWQPHNYGASFPIGGQAPTQAQVAAVWHPQTYGSNFPTGQQPLASGPTSAMWVPNNSNLVAYGAGFGNGGQFMQPFVSQGTIFPDMRPNIW